MSFVDALKNAFEIIKLNTTVIQKVSQDNKALSHGIGIILIGGAIGGITTGNLISIVTAALFLLIGSFIGYGVLHLVAILFKGSAPFINLYRVGTHAMILNWLSILALTPLGIVLSFVISLWSLVIGVVTVETLYKLSRGKAIVVVLIPVLLSIIIGAIIGQQQAATVLP